MVSTRSACRPNIKSKNLKPLGLTASLSLLSACWLQRPICILRQDQPPCCRMVNDQRRYVINISNLLWEKLDGSMDGVDTKALVVVRPDCQLD